MKKLALLAASIGLFAASPAFATGDQDFTVINNTGYTIKSIYVAQSSKDNWEEDVLDQDVLDDGERFKISFDRNESACLWDLKVDYDDGDTATWNAIDLCRISVVALRYDAKTGKTFARSE